MRIIVDAPLLEFETDCVVMSMFHIASSDVLFVLRRRTHVLQMFIYI